MKYIIEDSLGKKMIMDVVSSVPQLPEGFTILGLADDLPEIVAVMNLASSKEAQIKAAYDSMNADVYAEMEVVFQTKNPESATAYNETYKLMKEYPADFTSAKLVDEAAVIAFANAKLLQIKNYALFRVARIRQFQIEKNIILNS